MVRLRQPNFGNIRRLASSLRAPSSPLPSLNIRARRLGEDLLDYELPARELQALIEQDAIERGWGLVDPSSLIADRAEDLRSKGQKQVDTLHQRLEASGHEVPDSAVTGRQGIVGKLLNALGATGGAVTTLVHDLVDRDGQITPIQSLRKGFTGEDRKIGSDILDALGVENRIARGVGGFALDVGLDPLTYTGVGLARNVATAATRRSAREALERAGQKATDKELDTILQKAAGPTAGMKQRVTTDPRVATVAQAFGRPTSPVEYAGKTAYQLSDVAPTLPRQFDLEIGIPFTSRQRQIADLTPMMGKVGERLRSIPVPQRVRNSAEGLRNFARRTFASFPVPENVANLVRQRGWRVQLAGRKAAFLGEKIDRALGGGADVFPEVHKAIARAVDDPKGSMAAIDSLHLPTDSRKVVDSVIADLRKEFKDIAKIEMQMGILDKEQVRPFYFAHLLSGDRAALDAFRDYYLGASTSAIRTSGAHQRRRVHDTFEEFEQAVRGFNAQNPHLGKLEVNYDVGQVLATRKLASETMVQNAKLVDDIINLGPDVAQKVTQGRVPLGFTRMEGLHKKLNDYVLQEDVAHFMREWFEFARTGDSLNEAVRMWDNVLGTWKGLVTTTPGFHIRNFMGAMWNNWVMGTRDMRAYTDAMDMVLRGGIRRAGPDLDMLRSKQVTLPDGRTLDGEEILQLADHFGVMHAGWMGDTGRRSIGRIGRQRTRDNLNIFQHSREAGEVVDDIARLAGFMDQIRKTGDPYHAALNVKKHLFDYNELSKTEKQLFRRIVPFYTWSRKNIPLQIEALVRRPGMYTGLQHAQAEGAEMADIDIEDMPEWLANTAMVPFGQSQDGIVSYLNQFALPANDVFELLRGMSGVGEAGRFIGQQMAPGIKATAEVPLNRQFFSGAPIDYDADMSGDFPEGPALLNYIFQQTGLPYNLYRSITGERELVSTRGVDEEPRGDREFTARNLAPFDPRNPLGFLGMMGEYNPEYWQEEVLPYREAEELRGEVRRLAKRGETVYTKQEIDQAEELGLEPEQVRILREMLDEMGEQKSKKNLTELYFNLGGNVQ